MERMEFESTLTLLFRFRRLQMKRLKMFVSAAKLQHMPCKLVAFLHPTSLGYHTTPV